MLFLKLSPIFAVDILLTRKQNAIKAIFWDYQRLFLEKGADLFEEAMKLALLKLAEQRVMENWDEENDRPKESQEQQSKQPSSQQ